MENNGNTAVTSNSATVRNTVNDVQNSVASLLTAIVEAGKQQGCSDREEAATHSASILKHVAATSSMIDNLVGINHSMDEQIAEIMALSDEYDQVRSRILSLEETLNKKAGSIDDELERLLADEDSNSATNS